MTSKFGLKDFVLLVAILAVGLSVWLAMVQRQREWRQLGLVNTKLNELERHLVLMEDRLAAAAASLPASPAPGAPQAAAADTAWARPGVPVTRTGSWSFVHSPLAVEALEPDGTFTEIFEGQPPIITPYRYADVYGRRVVLGLVCESLGAYHPETLKLRGMLADAWQYAPDGTWARVHINPAARFSDGRPVTSEDVRYTYHDFMSNMEIQAERFRSVYSGIQTVTPIDPHTVEFVFKEPRFDNLDQALGFPIIPRHVYEHFTSTQVNQSTGLLLGSGPFKLEGFDPANPAEQWAPPRDIVLVRNESYWGPKPALERIRFKVVQDSLARLTAYTNGEGDMMRPIPIQWDAKVGLDAEGRPKDPDFLEHHNPLKWFNMQGGYSWIGWQCGPRNGKLTPFHDRRVRLAMTHLIDRETIRREIEKGTTRPATGPFLSSTPAYDQSVVPWPHDVERARALLAEAGWRDRNGDGRLENEAGAEFVFEFTYSQGSEGTLRMVTLVKDLCAASGIRCELRPVDWSIYQQIMDNRDFDAITMAWSASAPESDPYQIWHSDSIKNQGDNFIQWAHPEADRLIEAGRQEIDFEKRMKVWHELHRVFHEEQPYTYMSEVPYLRFVSRRVGNFHTYPSGMEYRELCIVGDRAAAAAGQ